MYLPLFFSPSSPICVCVCVHTHTLPRLRVALSMAVWRPEDKFQESVFSFHQFELRSLGIVALLLAETTHCSRILFLVLK